MPHKFARLRLYVDFFFTGRAIKREKWFYCASKYYNFFWIW